MRKDKCIFRVFPCGDVIALFPDIPWTWNKEGDITSYMHIGQHGAASKELVSELRKAKKAEYKPLLNELKNVVGYNI